MMRRDKVELVVDEQTFSRDVFPITVMELNLSIRGFLDQNLKIF